jgi:branched-chain amino acid transport system ATP-binding protein
MGGVVPDIVSTTGLRKEFRGFAAVRAVDLRVAEGSVHALVGPNGAGKTTLFNMLTGFLAPSAGRIEIAGKDVTGEPPERIARLGVARSFQITTLFPALTARDHVELALQARTTLGWRFWRSDKQLRRFRDRADELLGEVGLANHAEVPAGVLAYGRKRALELAVALALDPRLLLLDEPTAGMGAEDIDNTVTLVKRVAKNRTVVLVEHNMSVSQHNALPLLRDRRRRVSNRWNRLGVDSHRAPQATASTLHVGSCWRVAAAVVVRKLARSGRAGEPAGGSSAHKRTRDGSDVVASAAQSVGVWPRNRLRSAPARILRARDVHNPRDGRTSVCQTIAAAARVSGCLLNGPGC